MKFSRRATWIASGAMFALAASYYAFIFANRDRVPPENWDYQLKGGLMMIGSGLGIGINALFYHRLEAWRTRQRAKLKGRALGYDLSQWFRKK